MPRENQIGFLAPLVSFICIAIATSVIPNYDWAVNPLSDLGSWFRTDFRGLTNPQCDLIQYHRDSHRRYKHW
ncbi:MAG: hypothetical protein ACTSSE_10945 [Candidatus Thorarchaeota archaeon]